MGVTIPLLTGAYERLRHDIVSCAIAPGTEVSEAQLCNEYGFGKAAVRVALTRLAHDGLTRAVPRRGYLVAPVTLQDIQDVFELRLLLEPSAARMAAGKVSAQELRMHDEVCRAGYEPGDPESVGRYLDANKAFHVAIARATGNARLATAIEHLLDEMARLFHFALRLRKRPPEDSRQEHKWLLKALARGDGELAERVCRAQIEASRQMVVASILASRSLLNLAITADGA
jgi:DNA-binding GntR family transcriptional regulator